jgi:deoxycytidine triphosphate deaminase
MASPFNDPQFTDAFRSGPPLTETEAKSRYAKTADCDPFPEIAPALLNSSDIFNYVAATGMVYPFEEGNLKSASYAIRIGDTAIYWDGIGALDQTTLKPYQSFRVPDNSIVFIKSKEYFRLPWYIAMRFNLKIMNVHRGILLGTGPVVDPGFEGHLLIPLHNMTTNVYSFKEDETFVWVEFTKVSPNYRWDPSRFIHHANLGLHDKYKPFPKEKKDLNEWEYLYQAYKGPIRSSIPDAMVSSRRGAEVAKEQAEAAKTYSQWLTVGVVVTVVVTIMGFLQWLVPQLITINTLTAQAVKFEAEMREARTRDEGKTEQLSREIQTLRGELADARSGRERDIMNALEKRISDMETQLRALQDKGK